MLTRLALFSLFLAVVPTAPAQSVQKFPVVFSGGHETDPRDHGRPVVLIANALGVSSEVFREAFSHVHPAGPGSGGPTDAEARQNKAALMSALGKYGVTNDRLNTVSNYYRYPPGRGNLWRVKEASANALVKSGKVDGFEILDGGSGYSSEPQVSIPQLPGETKFKATISFDKKFEKNGAVTVIALESAKR